VIDLANKRKINGADVAGASAAIVNDIVIQVGIFFLDCGQTTRFRTFGGELLEFIVTFNVEQEPEARVGEARRKCRKEFSRRDTKEQTQNCYANGQHYQWTPQRKRRLYEVIITSRFPGSKGKYLTLR